MVINIRKILKFLSSVTYFKIKKYLFFLQKTKCLVIGNIIELEVFYEGIILCKKNTK